MRGLAQALHIAPNTMRNLLRPGNPRRLPEYDKLMALLRYTEMDPASLSEWAFTWRRLKYDEVATRRAAARTVPWAAEQQDDVPQADAA